ncbi:SDR family NAD(P)-dependent oxidoreductase [Oleomonas cavernae]|uniref:SDR family NAD(P)-dependent oxidoreductase n=1 Tax=Oleomonas cavernae TaxID=2320859 RepID=A0A418WFL2_9PROT|nr:SDR family NAD(P)-dependent oxidoreductase [Oleomonas cavernae]RJF88806.1 SDR family NAD(P)-dependent oxidoreductase [Oleomonas cavernae]
MRDLKGKVAVVTGGASGVGLALVRLLGQQGMKIAIADIDQAALDATVAELTAAGVPAIGVKADVTKAESVDALADKVFAAYGNVHLLFNNAGVGLGEAQRRIWTLPVKDWDWGFAVNLMGIVHGIRAFVPRMLEAGDEGMVINTSSANGGLFALPATPIYAATKAAVTALTETLQFQFLMDKTRLRAAVLFPGPNVVNTRIHTSARVRPQEFASGNGESKPAPYNTMRELVEATGLKMALTEPEDVASFALESVQADRFWMFPPSDAHNAILRRRVENIIERGDLPIPNMGI